MTKRNAVKFFGSQDAIAKLLGISRQAVSLWKECPPHEIQMRLHKATSGQLRADPKVLEYYRDLCEGVL